MAGFEPVESFGIDNGELDGLSPQRCFVLGVEWKQVAVLADAPAGFSRPVHSKNQERLRRLLDRRGRTYTLTFMPDDCSEGWMWLAVQPSERGDQ